MIVTLGVIIAVGSHYSYISKQLAASKQEITSEQQRQKCTYVQPLLSSQSLKNCI